MNEYAPLLISVVIAIFGSLTGIAALLKVNADRSNIVTEASTKVVAMVSDQLDDHAKRLESLENYNEQLNAWADKLIEILERAVASLPPQTQSPFQLEVNEIKKARPRKKNIVETTP
jgi:hypothetical protein